MYVEITFPFEKKLRTKKRSYQNKEKLLDGKKLLQGLGIGHLKQDKELVLNMTIDNENAHC